MNRVRTMVLTIYRPDGKSRAFCDELSNLLELIIVMNCNILLLGDVNIHLDAADLPDAAGFSSILDCFGLSRVNAADEPTHRAGHTLDVVVVKKEQSNAITTTVHPPGAISDHSLIVTSYPFERPQPSVYNATARAWKKFDRGQFQKDLASSLLCSTSENLQDKSVDELTELYSSTLRSLVDKHAPCVNVRKQYRPITPWFNAACRTEKRKARCFERVYRRTRTDVDRNHWLEQLKRNSEFYTQTQNVYWQTMIENSAGNARKLWNTLSSVMGKKRKSTIQDGLDAESFLRCFEDKINDVRASTAGAADPDYSSFHGKPLTEFSPVTIDDVTKLIRAAPNKACGLDPAPTWLVKDFVDELAPFITIIFNKSLCEGYFPALFRMAEITPILKKSTLDASNPLNYRPISGLPFLSKQLERVVNEQLLVHLGENQLLPEHQSAYRRSHSTETALLKVTSDVLLAADRGMVTLLGMLDLSAAFDCVDHHILLCRLRISYGITDVVLEWIASYLTGRSQYVRYNGMKSRVASIACGVPQGSVLGPLYYILYTSDVFKLITQRGFRIHGYADDLQIYDHCSVSDISILEARFTSCFDSVQSWMNSNRLRLNASKTEFIWLGSSRRLQRCSFDPLLIGGSIVHPAASVRDLGVILDPALSFVSHVARLTGVSFYHIRQLRTIRYSLTTDSCHSLVRALIVSRLDYCNGLLGGAPAFLLDRLSGVLRAAARVVLQLPGRSHITDAMKDQLHWLDIPARVDFKLCVLAFRCLHGSAPPYLARCCTRVIPGRSDLRSASAAKGRLVVPKTDTKTISRKAFAISCPLAWNRLPDELHDDSLSLMEFRRKLKTFLF